MAKLTDRTALVTPADGDFYVTTDVSDTSDAATGTDKKITWANIKAGLQTYFDTLYGAGNVAKVGTPANNQVGVWTGDGTLEGDVALTFDTTGNTLIVGVEDSSGFVRGAAATTLNTSGGGIEVGGGDGDGNASGGVAQLIGGAGGATGSGGNVGVYAGTGGVTSGAGGNAEVSGGDAQLGDSNGGNVILTGGASTGAGTAGVVELVSQTKVDVGLVPDANDGAYLGTSALAFSDLFLAEGGVINWDNGDATLTQTGNVVLLAGATLETSTVGTAANSVATIDGTQTLTNKTIGAGALTLAENASIALDPAGSADGKYSGITITGTAGADLAFGDLIYLAVADSRWELTDADASATGGPVMIGMCVNDPSGDGQPVTVLLQGQIRADSKFPALTIGAPVYLGETAGAIQTAIPTGADNVIRVVGFALTADEIYFNPSQDHQLSVA